MGEEIFDSKSAPDPFVFRTLARLRERAGWGSLPRAHRVFQRRIRRARSKNHFSKEFV